MICSYMSRLSWESHSIESWRWPSPIMTISTAVDCFTKQWSPITNTGWRVVCQPCHEDIMTGKCGYCSFRLGLNVLKKYKQNVDQLRNQATVATFGYLIIKANLRPGTNIRMLLLFHSSVIWYNEPVFPTNTFHFTLIQYLLQICS